MRIFKVFINGILTANNNYKIIIYLWVINFLYSFMLVVPIYFLINMDISKSLMGERMAQGFDLFWLGDFIYKFRHISLALIGWVIFPALIYLLLYIFLNGGIIGRLSVNFEKVNLKNFFSDCGQFFWRFFKLFLISIIVYIIFVGLIYKIIGSILEIFTKRAVTEWPLIIVSNLKIIIFLLLFTIINMFFDYAKIRLVISNSKKVLRETLFTLNFLRRRFFKVWALYLLICLLFLIITIIYLETAHIMPKNTMFFIFLIFIFQQIYIFGRLWVRLIFFASEIEFYRYFV
ncbi:hypothetical protein NLD30_11320 [SCandidatus Aminicenantes bacterium Aminicenantia_JdfR_composite]|jgi:hypothetical protein|nr:hypothetical protein [SCandidatus Aminicenantes bacterium Aminicenantia_JdfR_composite]